MLPVTSWLLVVWYAREAGAPWWATLLLSVAAFGLCFAVPLHTKLPWANALRSLACLAMSVYVASRLLLTEYSMLSVALLVVNALIEPASKAFTLACSVAAVGAVLFFESQEQLKSASVAASAAETWLAWSLSVICLCSKPDAWHALCAFTAPVLSLFEGFSPGWTYCAMVLPCICIEQSHNLREGLAPMLASLTDARRRQDTLLYCVAWAALLGLIAEIARLLLLCIAVLLPIVLRLLPKQHLLLVSGV